MVICLTFRGDTVQVLLYACAITEDMTSDKGKLETMKFAAGVQEANRRGTWYFGDRGRMPRPRINKVLGGGDQASPAPG